MDTWFPEPDKESPTYAENGETTFNWLKRSTVERAVKCRRLVNATLSYLPDEMQAYFFHDLQHRWKSAFFELIVARTLQEMGGTLEHETQLASGKRPDFFVTFPDGKVIVEATWPEINKSATEAERRVQPLLKIIRESKPEGWHIIAWEVPDVGPNDSKTEFEVKVKHEFDDLDVSQGDPNRRIDINTEISTGPICMTMIPAINGIGDVSGPPISYEDDTEIRIRKSVYRKKKQVRNSEWPVVLAIGCADGNLEDFDRALLGSTVGYVWPGIGEVARAFHLTGEWTSRKPSFDPPTLDGALVFCRIGFPSCDAPTFYRHPRSAANMPSAFSMLQQRYYGIGKALSTNNTIMEKINCVDFVENALD